MAVTKKFMQYCKWKLHSAASASITFLVKLLGKSILYFFAPLYSIVWCLYVSDDFVKFFSLGEITRIVLVGVVVYLSFNVFGNMIITHMTRSYARTSNSKDGVFCELCQAYRPKGSWHCPSCNTCIQMREQHCWVFDICVGGLNRRYYTLFLAYSTITSLFCGTCTLILLLYTDGVTRLTKNMFNLDTPMHPIEFSKNELTKALLDLEMKDIQMSYFLIGSIIFILYPGFLTYIHVKNILKGLTVNEVKRGKHGDEDWKKNIEKVFGTRWRSALFWPLVHSPLPDHEYKV